MSSKRKILSARANGAKNRGAKTPEASQRSAANNLKHGLVAHTVVLECENLQAFTDLLTAYERELQPQTEIESALVQTIAVCRWRLLRLWSIERSSLKIEMDKHDSAEDSPSIRAAMAFRTLSDDSRSLDLLNRYETRYDRQITRSLNMLHKLQARSPAAPPVGAANEFCRSEPIPNSDTASDTPPPSPDPIKSANPAVPPNPPVSSPRLSQRLSVSASKNSSPPPSLRPSCLRPSPHHPTIHDIVAGHNKSSA
jgi:hypothetical protein